VVRTLSLMYAAIATILLVMAAYDTTPAVLAVAVIVSGAFLGVINTVLTEAVMKVSPVERPVASSSYSFMRFAGGAIAPYLAGRLAENVSLEAPFLLGATMVVIALIILVAGRRHLAAAEDDAPETSLQVAIDEEPAGAIALERSAA
jgi:predicted MFS family arabinose efflux permease